MDISRARKSRKDVEDFDKLDPAAQNAAFQSWLKAERQARVNPNFYPDALSQLEIQTAVWTLLSGELAKHGVSEGNKAVTKFSKHFFKHALSSFKTES